MSSLAPSPPSWLGRRPARPFHPNVRGHRNQRTDSAGKLNGTRYRSRHQRPAGHASSGSGEVVLSRVVLLKSGCLARSPLELRSS